MIKAHRQSLSLKIALYSLLIMTSLLFFVTHVQAQSKTVNYYQFSVNDGQKLELWIGMNALKFSLNPEKDNAEHVLFQNGQESKVYLMNDEKKKAYSIKSDSLPTFRRLIEERYQWMKNVRDKMKEKQNEDFEEKISARETINKIDQLEFRPQEEVKWNDRRAFEGKFVAGDEFRGNGVVYDPAPTPVRPEHRENLRKFHSVLNGITNIWVGLQNYAPLTAESTLNSLPPKTLRLAKFETSNGSILLNESKKTNPQTDPFILPSDYKEIKVDKKYFNNIPDFDKLSEQRSDWENLLLKFFRWLVEQIKNAIDAVLGFIGIGGGGESPDKPVLLVHGFMDTTDTFWWWVLEERLKNDANYDEDQIYRINLEPIVGLTLDTPKDYATLLEDKVLNISNKTNKKVDIIAHSMGGLVSRWFTEKMGGQPFVDDLVTLGTPHQGTDVAKLGFFTGGGQAMFPESDFLKKLNGDDKLAPGIDYTAIWGGWDEAYLKQERAKIPADLRNGADVEIKKAKRTTHLALVWRKKVFKKYKDRLTDL